MTLTREQAIHLLEPVWIGLLASQLRAEAMLDALPFTGARDALKAAGELLAACDYIQEKGSRLDPSYLLQAVQTTKGKVLIFPTVRLSEEDMEAIQRAWLDRNPKLKAEVEARRAAQSQRVETTRNALIEKQVKKLEVAS